MGKERIRSSGWYARGFSLWEVNCSKDALLGVDGEFTLAWPGKRPTTIWVVVSPKTSCLYGVFVANIRRLLNKRNDLN